MQSRDDVDRGLARARALLVGVGGLGSPVAAALAEAGVGTLGLVDPDRVEVSNLHRQLLYDDGDVGALKVEVARRRLEAGRPRLRVETRAERFEARHVGWLRSFDVVVDGTDGAAVKFALNDAAIAARIPLVHAGAIGFQAQLLTVLPDGGACLRCLFEDAPAADEEPTCAAGGVLGPVVTLAGALAAAEAIHLLAGTPPLFAGRLLSIDLRAGTWRSVPFARNPACAACGTGPAPTAAPRSAAR